MIIVGNRPTQDHFSKVSIYNFSGLKKYKKRVYRNDRKNLPWDFWKVSWIGLFPTTLRFRKFRRSNVHRSVVVQSNHCQSCTAFFGWCALSRVSTFLFLRLFVPNNSAFAQPIFVEHTCCSNVVNSKVKACDIIIHNSWR